MHTCVYCNRSVERVWYNRDNHLTCSECLDIEKIRQAYSSLGNERFRDNPDIQSARKLLDKACIDMFAKLQS